ncbi:transglutaminase-like cysteine peptidase [Sulfurimonas sp.]|nr:transglutaminase-like cysteine peptidase [Sulfurimonas sp.]
MKLLLFLIITSILNASNYPSFSNQEIKKIENSSGKIAKNRVMDYVNSINDFKKLPQQVQLQKVNTYLNQLLPQHDAVIQNKEDHWATPKEFLSLGYGDCEDYVIIKYFTLLKLGFDKDKLYFTTVRENYTGGYHMVLSYFQDKNKPPLILDNLSFRVLDLKTRDDLTADLFISKNGVFKIKNFKELVKTHSLHVGFENLLKRVQKGN